MKHCVDHRKLGRTRPHRLALLRNQVTALIRHGRIETTLPKAKELRRVADRMVTFGKAGTLQARRRARRFVQDREILAKLFGDLASMNKERPGGYTRIVKLNFRRGDQAPMALLEYCDFPHPVRLPKKTGQKAEKKAAKKPKKKE